MTDLVQRLRSKDPATALESCFEAADEIERLTDERDEAHRLMVDATEKGSAFQAERDRLRAALDRINRDEFSEAFEGSTDYSDADYWRVVNIAREALAQSAGPPPPVHLPP